MRPYPLPTSRMSRTSRPDGKRDQSGDTFAVTVAYSSSPPLPRPIAEATWFSAASRSQRLRYSPA